jgi:hypothetical protein
MKKVAFYSQNLCLRGTEIAMYQYAHYNETILGNKSVIFAPAGSNMDAYPKFAARFDVQLMDFGTMHGHLPASGFDYLYVIKAGTNDGFHMETIPTLVHAVFRHNEPHGHKYFYVSDWLAKDQGYDPATHSVPHIVEEFPTPSFDLRTALSIDPHKTVFGCYGGQTEFNIGYVKETILRIVRERDDVVFLFMNIPPFHEQFGYEPHPNIIHLPGSWDMNKKSAFVHACDAMIHARHGGETFGCAVAEFSITNKPVITYRDSGERSHLDILGDRAILYSSPEEVYDIFSNLAKYKVFDDYTLPYRQFAPELIMERFSRMMN